MFRLEQDPIKTKGFAQGLVDETEVDVRPLIAKAGVMLVALAREKLSRMGGPSAPYQPPATVHGALLDTIGRTGPYTTPGQVTLAWGVGIGDQALARVNQWKAQGVNVYEYAHTLEVGGTVGEVHTRTYLPRPYIRPTEVELEGAITALWRAGLS